MHNYIKQLEDQNEELKQKFGEEQLKVIQLMYLHDLYTPFWQESQVPTTESSKEPREALRYTYCNRLYTLASILWSRSVKAWKVSWCNGNHISPNADNKYFAGVKDAKQHVDDNIDMM